MTIVPAKTYAALKAAGVYDAQALAAVEELGDLNDQYGGLSRAMHEMHADIKTELVGVRTDFKSELGNVKSEVASVTSEVASLTGEIAGVKTEVVGVRGEVAGVKGEVSSLRSDFKTELGDVRADFKTELGNVRSEVAYLRGRFDALIWAVGINAAATIAILGVLLRH